MKIIKKILAPGLIMITLISFALGINIALAQQPQIYPTVVETSGTSSSQIDQVRKLPGGDWRIVLSNIIKLILQITGSLSFISFTYGGVMMVTSVGNEEKTSKGKSIILWSLLALLIIAASYAIVLGITQISFL